MDLSSSKKAEAKKLGCTLNELVMADLISIGYTENDAYLVAYPEDAALSVQMQQANRRKIVSKITFQELCDLRRVSNAQTLEFSGDIEEIDLIDSETTAKEILKIARRMPEGSKERGEMFMKYADLTRKNDAATEEAMDAMQFYFPVKCNQCPLLDAYNAYMRQKKEQELRPVEMEAVIKEAEPIMNTARKKAGT
jgi:hypothetical protein